MRRLRFSFLTLLIVVTLVALVVNSLLPPRISFGTPEFSAFPAFGSHWGDIPATIIVRVPVKNEGIFPIWYKQVSPDAFALGSLPSTAEILSDSDTTIEWQPLPCGNQVQLREYGLERNDQVGIQVMDWMGRKFTIKSGEILIGPVWVNRHSLPAEIAD